MGRTSKTSYEKSSVKKANINGKLRSARSEELNIRRMLDRAKNISENEFIDDDWHEDLTFELESNES